ncbi:MAG: RsmB/NOP family class I SAM-dependent RNA methyltransferase [Pseudomonadota bacterium]
MQPAARLAAAIEVLEIFAARRAPVDRLLKEWSRRSRFAGARDRAAVSERVFAILRRRAECAFAMGGADDARSLVLGSLKALDGLCGEGIETLLAGGGYGPDALTEDEKAALDMERGAPPEAARLNCPGWIVEQLRDGLGEELEPELQALNGRAPVDFRVNTLARSRAILQTELGEEGVDLQATPHCIRGLRAPAPQPGEKPVNIKATKAYQNGHIEIQDVGSQIVSLLAKPAPGEQVVDLCAGGGGKTLSLAAEMKNTGQIYACDLDRRRLAAVRPRLDRAHVRNAQVRQLDRWRGGQEDRALGDLERRVDLVFVDAPCSGSGAWRRHPDAKWRLTPELLEGYREAQTNALARGARLIKGDGRMAYVTCSLLPCENDEQIESFLAEQRTFETIPPNEALLEQAVNWRRTRFGVQLSPYRTDTDGFYFVALRRRR